MPVISIDVVMGHQIIREHRSISAMPCCQLWFAMHSWIMYWMEKIDSKYGFLYKTFETFIHRYYWPQTRTQFTNDSQLSLNWTTIVQILPQLSQNWCFPFETRLRLHCDVIGNALNALNAMETSFANEIIAYNYVIFHSPQNRFH